MDKTVDNVDEEKRQRRLVKAPKGRVPKGLADDDSSGSSDFEHLVWKGKCWNKSTSDESEDEDGIGDDSDFELGAKPAVPATTYVSRRLARREKEAEVLPSEPVMSVDTDIEFLTHTVPDAVNPTSDAHEPQLDADKEEAVRAKAMADKDVARVQQRMQEEEAQRAVVPMEHEEATNLQQEGVHLTEIVGEQMEGQGEELQQPPPTAYTRRLRPPALQLPTALEEHEDQQVVAGEKQQELQAPVRVVAHLIAKPPYPAQNEDAQHDNLWKSRAGRKRKVPVDDVLAKPRRGRGRPPNPKTGDNARKKKQCHPGRRHKVEVAEDDPSSDEGGVESPEDWMDQGDSE
ncbi:hypothetical protein CBR_g40737 [Chara braunii]|uniref:Uncharacterized protein n=1 Tax=Chara braunii TaxID=69332 RepID=A0A388LUC7_CHABU|nr:hypothetical protein CBR_g40737 [Chara braunii]|eukprot:GBG85924.1 hypothetical protein CBR_g40737 [Chara braunii]